MAAIESVRRAVAAPMTSSVQPKAAEPAKVERNESASSMTAGYVEMASTVEGGLQTGASSEKNEEQPSDEELARRMKNAVQHANDQIKHSGRTQCEFSYHEKTNRISIRVLDVSTKEVIREIPAEETLEMVEKIWELAGILVDEKR